MPKIRAGDVEIFFQVSGSGPPLLLIAGFACDHLIWSKVVPALSASFRVITFDNRGMGRTTGDVSALTLRQMADDAAALLNALDIDSAHIVGHSMGGLIAQELAIAQPDRVKSLILISSCARLDERVRAIIQTWGDLPKRLDAEASARLILPWMYTNAFYSKPGAIEELVAKMMANPYPPTVEGIYAQSRASMIADTVDRLHLISKPTLVLTGREDILLTVEFSEQLARGIVNAELVILENSGHGLLIESAAAVSAPMLSFFSSVS